MFYGRNKPTNLSKLLFTRTFFYKQDHFTQGRSKQENENVDLSLSDDFRPIVPAKIQLCTPQPQTPERKEINMTTELFAWLGAVSGLTRPSDKKCWFL